MSETLACSIAADGERVHRYVAGTLDLEGVAQFESHLLGCAECQAAVREGVAVAAALRRISAPVVDPVRVGRWRRWWAVPLAAAAASALWLVMGREGPLARLGRVSEAPVFAGVAVRGDADSASRLADSGMAVFTAGRYREAARLLGAVAPEDRTPALSFYLGVATLLGGDPAGAVAVFGQVPAESPYAPEAHFYSAKAWLQSGRGDSALTQLAAVPASTRIAAHAAALADSVREVVR